jgi:hypothetical protein
MQAAVSVLAETLDLVFQQQFATFEFQHFQIVYRGVRLAIVDSMFERLVFFFEFREMRLHRHA